MKTLREINLEYWGRVHDMCKGTALENAPWLCVMMKCEETHFMWCSLSDHPNFQRYVGDENCEFKFAVAILEDKPVFVGDIIYRKYDGFKVLVDSVSDDESVILDFDNRKSACKKLNLHHHFTWNPQKPKRTFTLNGVELPCPVDSTYPIASSFMVAGRSIFFKTPQDCKQVYEHIQKILTEARDK